MNLKQKDIILIPFPFSNLVGKKVRPGLILSRNSFNQKRDDIIICGISSNTEREKYAIIITTKNLEEGILHQASAIKVDYIHKIDKKLVIKKIGRLNDDAFAKVMSVFDNIFKDKLSPKP